LGVNTSNNSGSTMVTKVTPFSAAFEMGMKAGDELIAIGEHRVEGNLGEVMSRFNIGDETTFVVSREGKIRLLDTQLGANPNIQYTIVKNPSANKKQKTLYEKWIGTAF